MLKHRLLYGLLVGAAFAACMAHLPGPLLFALLAAFTGACQWEFYALASRGGHRVYPVFGVVLGVIWLAAVYLLSAPAGSAWGMIPGWEGALLLLMVFAVLLRVLVDTRSERAFESTSIMLLGLVYGPFLMSYFVRLMQWGAPHALATIRGGVYLCFYVAFIVKLSDAGAYGFGMNFGRHKLMPRISPAKSWEGLAGGLLVGVLCSLGAAVAARAWEWGPPGVFWPARPVGPVIVTPLASLWIGLLLTAVGVLGDLIESMFKRAVRIKDSSSVIPGMGGLLDIVDSLIFPPAVLYLCLLWMSP